MSFVRASGVVSSFRAVRMARASCPVEGACGQRAAGVPGCGVSFFFSFLKTFLKRIIFCFYLLFSCVFVTSSAVGRACHSAWRARARGACAAGGLFDLPRCAAPCVRPSGNYCRLRWPGGRAGRAKLNCGTQKFLQFFWCQATEQQNNTT